MTRMEVIQGCIRGDSSAREALYVTYYPRLLTMCRYYLDSTEVAQDLLHDAFIIIFSSIGSLRDPEKLEPWMGSIVRNLSIDYLKIHGHDDLWDENASLLIPEEDSGGIKIPPFEDLIKMVDALPERYGQVFRLSVLHGLSNKEIAGILQIREHTASSDLFRAKKLLKEAIKRYWALNTVIIILLISTVLLQRADKKDADSSLEAFIAETEIIIPDASLDDIIYSDVEYPIYNPAFEKIIIAALPIHEKDEVAVIPTNDDVVIPEEKHYTEADDSKKVAGEIEAIVSNQYNWGAPEIKKKSSRRVALALSGNLPIGYGSSSVESVLYDANSGSRPSDTEPITLIQDNKTEHRYPIRLGLMAEVQIKQALSLRIGMEYTYLSSTEQNNHTKVNTDQKLHYLGIPIGLSYTIWGNNTFAIKGFADVAINLPIQGVQKYTYFNNSPSETHKVKALILWSTGIGFGLHYNINRYVGIYAAPGLRYYFGKENDVKTIYTDTPLEFTLSVGLSFQISSFL